MYGRLSTQRILSFTIVVASFSRLQSGFIDNNPWEDYHSSCPYNNFCTRNATKFINSKETDSVSCCQECSCDPECQKFGVCCPDYNLVAGIDDVIYPCVLMDDYFNYPRGLDQSTKKFNLKYHIVDDCTQSVEYRNQCETPVLLEDFVVVSDVTNGRVYKNKHCALCHGVKEFEEWGIVTTCQAVDRLSFETFEERDKYIVKYCPILPYPPPSQAKSLYRCIDLGLSKKYYENCEDVDEINEVDEGVVNSCEGHTPYTNARIYSLMWFKNIYCFWCNRKTEFSQNLLCKDLSLMYTSRSELSFTMLLDTNIRPSDRSEECNTSSILDPYTDSCLQLYCSPGTIPNSGKCRSVSRDSTGVKFAMVFKAEFNGSIEMYRRELLQSYRSIINSAAGNIFIPCRSFKDSIIFETTGVFLISYLTPRHNCTRDFLMSNMLELFSNFIISAKFVYLNTTIEVKLTSSTKSYEMIYPNNPLGHVWHNVFRGCTRIDYRMVPLLVKMNPDTMFQGNVIDNKVCVRDYFEYAELLSNAKCTLKQNLHVLIFNILLLIDLVLN